MQVESSSLFCRLLCPQQHAPTIAVKLHRDQLPRLACLLGSVVVIAGLIGCGQSVEESAVKERAIEAATNQDSPFLVIAHRGASAQRPEHTIAAYELAIKQNADFIELDLVPTRDGALIARHENALAVVALNEAGDIERDATGQPKLLQATTDVAQRPEFVDRLTIKRIDGRRIGGWFSEDFSLAEIKTLWARERIPQIRPNNVAFNDQFRIPTLEDAIALLQRPENARVGLYLELKHPTYFAHEARLANGEAFIEDTAKRLVRTLARRGFTQPSRLFLQCFEVETLLRLQDKLLPAAGFDAPLIQLFGSLAPDSLPYDMHFHLTRAEALVDVYPALAPVLSRGGSYAELGQPNALAILQATYAEGIGPNKTNLAQLADGAAAAGLAIHPYTVRPEAFFLDPARGGLARSIVEELRTLRAQGATGVFIDQPEIASAMAW